jgi:hypothetical protein
MDCGLAAVGVAVGLGLSLAVARLLRGLLFGVGAYDPAAFLAARIDPTVALRQD